jgi:ABC-type branched-subunit amino acid transport system substrate-binding protein
MPKVSLPTIKNWFKTGLKPTQSQFWDTWDSFWHKDDQIPSSSITGLDAVLAGAATQQYVNDAIANIQNAITYQDMQGNGTNTVVVTAFTMPTSDTNYMVTLDGIERRKGATMDFTVSGNTITFFRVLETWEWVRVRRLK